MEMAGYTTNQTLTNMYTEYREERPTEVTSTKNENWNMRDWTLPEPTVIIIMMQFIPIMEIMMISILENIIYNCLIRKKQ